LNLAIPMTRCATRRKKKGEKWELPFWVRLPLVGWVERERERERDIIAENLRNKFVELS
jgi:hypothetical protein